MTLALEGGEGSATRPGRTLPPGKTRYPLYRRLGGPQGWSGLVRKISPSPRFDPRTVQPIDSRYTDYATWPTKDKCKIWYLCGLIYLWINTCLLSFGWFHGAWILYANVLEHSVCAIFVGGVRRKNFFLLTPPMKMEQTVCSKTSAYKIQAPGNHPKVRVQHSEHGKSLKSRVNTCFLTDFYFPLFSHCLYELLIWKGPCFLPSDALKLC